MRLRTKTILAIFITFFLVILLGYVYTQTAFMDGYINLENQDIETIVNRYHYTLGHEIEHLGTLTSDWASWDDTYAFMDDSNPDYIDSNLVDSTFSELGLNFIIYLDSSGNEVVTKAYDFINEEEIPLSNSISSYVISLALKSLSLGEVFEEQGIFSENDEPAMFAARPILTSEDQGPAHGTLIFGKNLIGRITDHLNLTSTYEAEIVPYSSENYNSSPVMPANQGIRVDKSRPDYLITYSLIRDANGSPIFILKQTLPRTIYLQGLESGRNFLFSIFIFGLFASAIALTALEFGFLRRFSRLIKGVKLFEPEKLNGSEMVIRGNDEISNLSREMQNALLKLAETQNSLTAHLDFEKLLMRITTRFITMPIETIDEGIDQLLKVIGKFSKVDRCYVFVSKPGDPRTMSITNEWCKTGVSSIKANCHKISINPSEPWLKKLQNGETITMHDATYSPCTSHEEEARVEKSLIQTAAATPLIIESDFLGFLCFDDIHTRRIWSDQTLLLLEMVGAVVVNALDRNKHEKQILTNQQYFADLNELTRKSIGKSTLPSACRAISYRLNRIIRSDSAFLVIPEEKDKVTIFKGGRKIALDEGKTNFFQLLYEKSGNELLQTGEIEFDGNPNFDGFLDNSFLIVPLISQGIKYGLVIFTYKTRREFSKDMIAFIKQAATLITLSVLKTKVLEAANQKTKELSALRETIADITSELQLDKLLHTLLKRSIRLMKADGGNFCMVNEETSALKVVASVNLAAEYVGTMIPYGSGASGKVFLTKQVEIIKDYSVWSDRLELLEDSNMHATIVLPLNIGDRVLGTLGIFHSNPDKQFTPDDQHLLSLLAQHASIAIENALLFEQVQKLARIDDITGMYNRRAFIEVGEYEIKRAHRQKHALSLAMLDLDKFKAINDIHGHQVGDEVLKEIASICRGSIRNMDVIARYGGDEMIILMPETDTDAALLAMERLRKVIENSSFNVKDKTATITVSIGVVAFEKEPPPLSEIINLADSSLYAAKEAGKNCVYLFKNKKHLSN